MINFRWEVLDFNFDEINILKIKIEEFIEVNIVGSVNNKQFYFDIIFKDFVSFNLTDESYLIKFFNEMDPALKSQMPFLVFNESKAIDNFYSNNLGFYDTVKIKHYAIYTENDCIDVLVRSEPIVLLKN